MGARWDTVGANVAQGSAYPFLLDGTAPTTTASGLQANASSGWIKTSQTVTLTPTDTGGSGLAATYYTLDGTQHTYAGTFTVSGQASHTITYWSTDAAGNEETHHTGYVNIDGVAPTTTASPVSSPSDR